MIANVPASENIAGFYSNLFIAPNWDVRPILEALNQYLAIQSFWMECVRSVGRFLRFEIGHHFEFVALPFGLSTAPQVFKKVLKESQCLVI